MNTISGNKVKSNNLLFLDGLRGIAAFYVLVGHSRWLLWEGYSGYQLHKQQYSGFEKFLVYFLSLFKYGHEMVLFFFVLSGFVIHLRYSTQISNHSFIQFDYSNYIFRRISRIYPPLIVAMVLGYLFDTFGRYLGYTIYFQKTTNVVINNNVSIDFSLKNLLGNLFFMQKTYFPVWGSNGPLWSLKFEWWFYMLYPLLFIINKKGVMICLGIVTLVSFTLNNGLFSIPFNLLNEVLAALLSWWLGTLLADIYTKRLKVSFLYLSPLTLFIFIAPLSDKIEFLKFNTDNISALGFFGLLSLLFYLQSKGVRLNKISNLRWLGEFSYTLYIIHVPILVFISGFLLSKSNNNLPKTQGYIFLGIFIPMIIAYYLHFYTEKYKFIRTAKSQNSSI